MLLLLTLLIGWQVRGSEDEWLEKQIESEKSITALEQQIRELKVRTDKCLVMFRSYCVLSCIHDYHRQDTGVQNRVFGA